MEDSAGALGPRQGILGLDPSPHSLYSFNTMFMQSSLPSKGGLVLKEVERPCSGRTYVPLHNDLVTSVKVLEG